MPVTPANGAALTDLDRDPDLFPDVIEMELPESPFEGLPE
jgi:hypothetical protein